MAPSGPAATHISLTCHLGRMCTSHWADSLQGPPGTPLLLPTSHRHPSRAGPGLSLWGRPFVPLAWTSLCLTGCSRGVLPLLGEPPMAQKGRQPLCITGGGFKPPFLHGGVLAWVKGEDLTPKFTLLGEREGLWRSHSWTPLPCTFLWASHNNATKNHPVPGAKGEGRKKKPPKKERYKRKQAAHRRAECVSRQQAGRPGGAGAERVPSAWTESHEISVGQEPASG